jgi:hypothetical protein
MLALIVGDAGVRGCAVRATIGTSRSVGSLFITYSSTNRSFRSRISQYAESRMIGGWETVA